MASNRKCTDNGYQFKTSPALGTLLIVRTVVGEVPPASNFHTSRINSRHEAGQAAGKGTDGED